MYLILFRENRALISLVNDPNKRGEEYRDNLCFFRCLALHQGYQYDALEKQTRDLFQQYSPTGNFKKFHGVKLSDLHTLEEMYEINIVVYEMVEMEGEEEDDDDGKKDENHENAGTVTDNSQPAVVVRLVQHSLGKYKETM